MSLKSYIEEKPARVYTICKVIVIGLLGLFIIGAAFISSLILKDLLFILFVAFLALILSLPTYNFLASNISTKIIKKIFRFFFRTDLYEVQWLSKEFESFLGQDFEILNEIYEDYFKLRIALINSKYQLSDYSCMVLPLAKAYEGVLKKILVSSGFITEADLQENPNISINKYFNPVGNNAIFKALKDQARDKAIPYIIYSTYQECRNLIFHYDPYRDNRLKSIGDADFYQRRIDDAIKKAFETFHKLDITLATKAVKNKK